jgi:hypothetical protein
MRSTHQALRLLAWAGLSVATSIYNKWLLDQVGFNFPALLSFAHMAGAAVLLHLYLTCLKPGRSSTSTPFETARIQASTSTTTTGKAVISASFGEKPAGFQPAADPTGPSHDAGWAEQHVWWLLRHGLYLVPVSAMFAAGMGLRNSAFVGLPLPMMQLLASSAPLLTYALSVAVGLVPLDLRSSVCMVACVVGVAIAVADPSNPFEGAALVRHAAGIGLDVAKGVVLQMLIVRMLATLSAGRQGDSDSKGSLNDAHDGTSKNDCMASIVETAPVEKDAQAEGASKLSGPAPLSTVLLAVYSPLCAAMLLIPAAGEIGPALTDAINRPPWFVMALAGNIAVALGLNLVAVSCLQHVGVVALSLTAFAKNWGLILLSSAVFGKEVTPRFVAGMLITSAAVLGYTNLRLRRCEEGKTRR